MKAPDADIYLHEMPGQFTDLQEQARAGLISRWPEICEMYAAVNQLLGDIVKGDADVRIGRRSRSFS
jgi:pyruvate carboxylase